MLLFKKFMVLKFGNAADPCIMGNINTLLTREAKDDLQKIYTLNCLHGKRGGVFGRPSAKPEKTKLGGKYIICMCAHVRSHILMP